MPRQRGEAKAPDGRTRAEVLAFVTNRWAERRAAPTYREIATAVGATLGTIRYHVHGLIEAGELAADVGPGGRALSRTLRPAGEAKAAA